MFESIINFFKNIGKTEKEQVKSKDAAKERLHLVLMQDRANVSADFLDLMKQEIIEVIKKYIDVDENAIDVRLTNKANGDGTTGAPALYANIPIVSIKEDVRSKMARQKENATPINEQQEKQSTSKNELQENKEEANKIEENSKVNEEIIEPSRQEVSEEIKQENEDNVEEDSVHIQVDNENENIIKEQQSKNTNNKANELKKKKKKRRR